MMKKIEYLLLLLPFVSLTYAQKEINMEAPASAPEYGIAEFVFRVENPVMKNPFTDIQIKGRF